MSGFNVDGINYVVGGSINKVHLIYLRLIIHFGGKTGYVDWIGSGRVRVRQLK